FFFRIRIEVHEPRWLGLDRLGFEKLSIHPKAERDRSGVLRALARESDANGVVAGEVDAVLAFNSAAIDAADLLLSNVKESFDGLRRDLRGDGPGGDAFGGGEVSLHEHRRYGEHVADVVEAVAGIVGGEIFLGAELHAEQVANGVGVLVAIE